MDDRENPRWKVKANSAWSYVNLIEDVAGQPITQAAIHKVERIVTNTVTGVAAPVELDKAACILDTPESIELDGCPFECNFRDELPASVIAERSLYRLQYAFTPAGGDEDDVFRTWEIDVEGD